MSFDKSSHLNNQHPNQDIGYLHQPRKFLLTHCVNPPLLSESITILIFISIDFFFGFISMEPRWTHRKLVSLFLASFAQYNVFDIRPCLSS